MNRPELELRRCESAKNTWNPCGRMQPDARAAASLARRHVGRGCGTSGAVSVLYRFYPPPSPGDIRDHVSKLP